MIMLLIGKIPLKHYPDKTVTCCHPNRGFCTYPEVHTALPKRRSINIK